MAYYDALIAAWNAGGIPVGASGTAITSEMTTEQKLAAVNGWTVPATKLVPIADVVTALRDNQTWYGIRANALSDTPNMGALAAYDLYTDPRQMDLNFANPVVQAMGALLINGNLMTQAQWDALVALGNTTQNWWENAGYPRAFDAGDCEAAGVS